MQPETTATGKRGKAPPSTALPPGRERLERAARQRADFAMARDAFAERHGARPVKWSGYNLGRLLRRTGERPERVAEMRAILGDLGMGDSRHWPAPSGVFDHGAIWGRSGKPWCVVGHPYQVSDAGHDLLRALARFGTLRVGLNDEPSYYGHGTDHVRIELVEPREPFVKPRATPKTRAAARAARRAFAESFG